MGSRKFTNFGASNSIKIPQSSFGLLFRCSADDDLGRAAVTVREMLLAVKTVTVDLHGGTYRGGRLTLRCDVCKLDLVNRESLEQTTEDGHKINKNRLSGLVTVLVVGAKKIPVKDKKQAKTFVRLRYGTETEFVTGTVVDAKGVDALNPVYDKAFEFLNCLLSTYAQLGTTLLTVVMDRIQQASYSQDGKSLMRYMEFMCTSLVGNSHCAQEIWNTVGIEWLQHPHSPLTIRIALIRLFPAMVAGNKRLYRRVIEEVGVCLGSHEITIRLSAAATIADLAQQDDVRDVSDIIGWIQGLLTVDHDSPMHSLLVHYAVLSLHYLIVSGELDFNVVIKVLNKKLCSISDHGAIMKQPLEPVPDEIALAVLKEQLRVDSLDEVFAEPPRLVASASLGQVYQATLKGENKGSSDHKNCPRVAIKVQRPGMLESFSLDLYILQRIGVLVDGFTSVFTNQPPFHKALYESFARGSYQEMDYQHEAESQQEFRRELAARQSPVVVPAVYPQYTTRTVLTTEWIEGRKLADSSRQDIRRLIPVGVELFLTQLLDIGKFHA